MREQVVHALQPEGYTEAPLSSPALRRNTYSGAAPASLARKEHGEMAKTIAIARGSDKSRCKETWRLGSVSAESQANAWRTFTTCQVNADGSGFVQVRRDDLTLHYFA